MMIYKNTIVYLIKIQNKWKIVNSKIKLDKIKLKST